MGQEWMVSMKVRKTDEGRKEEKEWKKCIGRTTKEERTTKEDRKEIQGKKAEESEDRTKRRKKVT